MSYLTVFNKKLISCVFEANGTPRAAGGCSTLSSFGMNKEGFNLGMYRIVHSTRTLRSGLNAKQLLIQAASGGNSFSIALQPVNLLIISNKMFQHVRCCNGQLLYRFNNIG